MRTGPVGNRRGFTLIGTVMVLIVLGLAIPPLMIYMAENLNGTAFTTHRIVAIELARDLMEEIKSKNWDENYVSGPMPLWAATSHTNLGPDGSELRNGYDDIDDYEDLDNMPPVDCQGAALTEYPQYRRRVNVQYCDDTTFNWVTTPTNHKRIRVSVHWGGSSSGGEGVVRMELIMSNR